MKSGDFKEIERVDGHIWGIYKSDRFESCLNCMMIRRRDKANSPCKGRAKLRPFQQPVSNP